MFFQHKQLKQNNFDFNFFIVWLLLIAIYWLKPSIMGDALVHYDTGLGKFGKFEANYRTVAIVQATFTWAECI